MESDDELTCEYTCLYLTIIVLYRKVCGVCGGIANYFDVDPTVIRLAWVIFTLAGGSGLIAYIIAAIIMPEDPGYIDMQ